MALAQLSDLAELARLEKECDAYFDFDPPCKLNHSATIEDCLLNGDGVYRLL